MIAGIASDNYKLDKFKKELNLKGYSILKITPFTHGVSIIKVFYRSYQAKDLKNICTEVELFFKHSN